MRSIMSTICRSTPSAVRAAPCRRSITRKRTSPIAAHSTRSSPLLTMMRASAASPWCRVPSGRFFTYHRELELYQLIGMEPAEIPRLGRRMAWPNIWASTMSLAASSRAIWLTSSWCPVIPTEDLRAIKTISMVVADGRVYFPGEIYPRIRHPPFHRRAGRAGWRSRGVCPSCFETQPRLLLSMRDSSELDPSSEGER